MSNNFENDKIKFHYNREERLAMKPVPPEEKSKVKGLFKLFFRNKKPLNIIFANIILVCILFSFFIFYTQVKHNTFSNSDFSFSINGYIFDNNLFLTLIIKKKQDSKLSNDPIPVEAVIFLSDNKEFYKKFFDNMPADSNKETVLRAIIPGNVVQKKSLLLAKIEYSNNTINIKSKIKSEK